MFVLVLRSGVGSGVGWGVKWGNFKIGAKMKVFQVLEEIDGVIFRLMSVDESLVSMSVMRSGENPIRRGFVRCSEDEWSCYSALAELTGLAAVFDGNGVTVFGTEVGFTEWSRFVDIMAELSPAVLDSLGATLMSYANVKVPKIVRIGREERINATMVAHAVSNKFPDLRIWPDDARYDPSLEIQLKATTTGGLRLGGIKLI